MCVGGGACELISSVWEGTREFATSILAKRGLPFESL